MTRNDIRRGVRQVVKQVVSLVRPQRVIRFGSAAEGRVGPDSDLDFLVVVPDGRNVRQVADCLNVGVRCRPMPCDFLVVTPSIARNDYIVAATLAREAVSWAARCIARSV